MDERVQGLVAENESAFRKVNESIERGLWPGEEGSLVSFRCECARLSCVCLIELTPLEYEHVRASSRRFFISKGHQIEEAETVVETHQRYVVVEKQAVAGAVAEANDPRD